MIAIREDLYNPDHRRGELLAKQVESLAGDVQSMEWIQKAGYAPEEAVSALDLIYPKPAADKKIYPVVEALRGDAHEGVRYAALQAQIENLRRESLTPLKTEVTPIMAGLSVNKSERKHLGLSAEELADFKEQVRKLVLSDFATEKSSLYFRRIVNDGVSNDFAKLDAKLVQVSESQAGAMVLEFSQMIEGMKISNQKKGNAVMRILTFFNGANVGETYREPYLLMMDESMRIAKTLKSFSTGGKDGWKGLEYLKLQADEVGAYREWTIDRAIDTVLKKRPQSIFKNLYALDAEFKTYINELLEFQMHSGEKDINRLTVLIRQIQSADLYKGPMRGALLKELFGRVSKLDLAREAANDGGMRALRTIQSLSDKDYSKEVNAFAEPLVKTVESSFQNYYETKMIKRFSAPLGDLKNLPNEVANISRTMKELKLSESFRQKAKPFLMNVAREWATNPLAYPGDSFLGPDPEIFDGPITDLYSELLETKSLPKADRIALIDYLISVRDSNENFAISKPEIQRLTKSMRSFVMEMTPAEVIAWAARDVRTQYGSTLANLLSEAQSFPIKDVSEPEIDRLKKAIKDGVAGPFGAKKQGKLTNARLYADLNGHMDRVGKYGGKLEYIIKAPFARNVNMIGAS